MAIEIDPHERFWSGTVGQEMIGADVFVDGEKISIGVYNRSGNALIGLSVLETRKLINLLSDAISRSEKWHAIEKQIQLLPPKLGPGSSFVTVGRSKYESQTEDDSSPGETE